MNMNKRFILERNNDTFWIILEWNNTFWKLEGNKNDEFLEHNKKLRMIIFGNKLATVSTNIENHAPIFITFFNIYSFAAHIQIFWTQIMNSDVFAKIFISQKWALFPTWFVGYFVGCRFAAHFGIATFFSLLFWVLLSLLASSYFFL